LDEETRAASKLGLPSSIFFLNGATNRKSYSPH
jgi:hypothetical protein